MDMRRAARIGHRPDREKLVIARGVGRRRAVALEILIARPIDPAIPDIMVTPVRVALPDLDPRCGDGASIGVEKAAGDPRDAAFRRARMSGNMDQIIA